MFDVIDDYESPCDYCDGHITGECKVCGLGNPCLSCTDYDVFEDRCTSNGGCATVRGELL